MAPPSVSVATTYVARGFIDPAQYNVTRVAGYGKILLYDGPEFVRSELGIRQDSIVWPGLRGVWSLAVLEWMGALELVGLPAKKSVLARGYTAVARRLSTFPAWARV
ncbi:MAG: hypothetical protein Q7S00_00190, partial [bacterium]|nr:hypothetical protein [bacterium]